VAVLIAEMRRQEQRCAVGCFTSPAVRIASAALERGLDIRDTLFLVSGEALTTAKRELIESAGCQVLSRYHIAEVGPVGYGCYSMDTGNSVHLFHDSVAAINYSQLAPLSEVEVNSLQFTTLLPTSAKILINVDMDDVGNIEPVDCDCLWARSGFDKKISNIHSVGKLTGYGMTLVGTEIVQILEEKLPKRFGGSPADYQLVEQEGTAETRLVLRVSPRVKTCSPTEVRDVFLKEIRACYAGCLASRVWDHADALLVTQAEPLVTPGGKVLPLQLLRSSTGDEHVA
jgi:phenylacetate-coenzyme A ligase PaaK-like adenylate-forming protein